MLILTMLFWWLYLRGKTTLGVCSRPVTLPEPASWPVVTIQLPLYNEKQVAGRLIDAVVDLDYPLDRLQIQVLDDSTDETRQIVDEVVNRWQQQGHWIDIKRRVDRCDYKAGALRAGLESAQGEYIAIFDADFVPPRSWLKAAICPFLEPGGEKIGVVQTRWSHINERYSLLTRAQALALDAHFGIEQNVRYNTGLFLNFNGTAGIWRRQCIDEAGSWRGATLSEDLDLSYRAQICGWQVRFLMDVTAPAELPTLMVGYKRQQFRWTKGSIQTVRLLGPKLIASPCSLWRRYQGFIHLTSYLAHPLMVIFLLLTLPLTLWGVDVMKHLPLGWMGIITLGPPLFFATSQGAIYGGGRFWQWLTRFPLLAMLGVGIAANNTRAVLEGLSNRPNVFERTPKTGVTQRKQARPNLVTERFTLDPSTWLEIFLCLYSLVTAVLTIRLGNYMGAFFFVLYTLGFGWVALASLHEAQVSHKYGV